MAGGRGLKNHDRTPREDPRARRNAQRFAGDASSLFSGALAVDDEGYVVLNLQTDGGLSQSAAGLTAVVAAPIALDATGIHLDYSTGLTLDGTDLVLDILGLTTDVITAGDWVPFHDLADAPNKIAFSDFEATLNHDNLTDVDANEHIDWTAAVVNLVTTGYGDFASIYFNGTKILWTPDRNIFLGEHTGFNITGGNNNVAIGFYAGTAITDGDFNVCAGSYAASALQGGSHNFALGYLAMASNVNGSEIVCVGTEAGKNLTGAANICIGWRSGYRFTTGILNCFIGGMSGYNAATTSGYNVYIGGTAGYGAAGFVAASNVGIGAEALYKIRDGSHNVAIGRSAGFGQSTGSYCMYLGKDAGYTDHTYSYSIAFGYHADFTADNQWVVGSVEGPITTIFLGEGVVSATPQDVTINATGGDGTDIAAGDFIFSAGRSTGDADPGKLLFQTAPAGVTGDTPQTLATRMTILGDGGVQIHSIKSGATQVASGAAADELWKTNGHASLPDNVVMIGI